MNMFLHSKKALGLSAGTYFIYITKHTLCVLKRECRKGCTLCGNSTHCLHRICIYREKCAPHRIYIRITNIPCVFYADVFVKPSWQHLSSKEPFVTNTVNGKVNAVNLNDLALMWSLFYLKLGMKIKFII